MRIHHDGGDGVGQIRDVAELRGSDGARAAAAHREAEINLVRHRNRRTTELRPRLPIVTREAGERVADAAQTQPGVGIIRRKTSGRAGVAASGITPLEERTIHRRRRHRRSKTTADGKIFARHQTSLCKNV